MIDFKLNPKNFNYLGVEYDIIQITFLNYQKYSILIQMCIDYFNEEIEWNEMFDINQAKNRLSDGMVLYVCLHNTEPLGYVWFKEMGNDEKKLFNLFFRNKNIIKTHTGKEFISSIINTYENAKIIVCEVDDWNEKSIKLFKKLGFEQL